MRTFLIGGGRQADAVHEAFVEAANGPLVAFVLDEGSDTNLQRWSETLVTAGATEHRVVVVSPERPPTAADLDGVAGVYVAGGLTPGYHRALVAGGTEWLARARDAGLTYAGFSADTAIAPAHALVGGARVHYRGQTIDVCDEDFAEELDVVTVLPGLDLVPFTVDVHAAQWGTLYRLVHALTAANVAEGWAIDENTALEVTDGMVTVHGSGAATRVRRQDSSVTLSVHVAGDQVPVPGSSDRPMSIVDTS